MMWESNTPTQNECKSITPAVGSHRSVEVHHPNPGATPKRVGVHHPNSRGHTEVCQGPHNPTSIYNEEHAAKARGIGGKWVNTMGENG